MCDGIRRLVVRVKECNPASQCLHMTLIAAERGWPGLLVYTIVIPQPIVSGLLTIAI